MPTFTAPTLSIGASNVVLTFRLTVEDPSGESSEDDVVITITAPANTVPVADAGTAQTVSSGVEVTLDGSGSSDADSGQSLTYEWRQISGPTAGITLSDATAAMPTFTAPTLSIGASNVVLTFGLVVNDSFNESTEDQVVITITAPPNTVPTANAGMDQNAVSGSLVTLDGSGSSDAESGQSLMYEWTQVGGDAVVLSDATAEMPTFIAPNVSLGNSPLLLSFQLVVNDGEDSATDIVEIAIRPPFNLDTSGGNLLSGLTLTETITSNNLIHLQTAGYDTSSAIFAGGFNTTSASSQLIYEAGGDVVGTTLLIDNVGGQLTFVVSTGTGNDIDISSAISVNTNYVYIVEITGATNNSTINLYIAEGTRFISFK